MTGKRFDIENELLVMDAQNGDVKAMEKLVARWQKRLWSHAYRLTGNTDAAWDITQQSWLGIIKGLHKLHDPANFKAWAYGISTNKSIDWIRKHKNTRHFSLDDIKELPEKNQRKETGLREFLGMLDITKKTVLCLYYFERLSTTEIGVILRIPKGTVKSRLYIARKELKELWQKYTE